MADEECSPVDNFIIKNYRYKDNITALGIGELAEFKKNYPAVRAVTYGGREFPFDDNEFDIAHSNAVIEHVGGFEAQKIFLSEIVRVSKRGMITTPNRGFPIETHTRVPLLHWMGKENFDKFLRLIGKDFAIGDYMYLLGKADLKRLASAVGLKNYRIIRNRLFGMTMTFTLIWQGE